MTESIIEARNVGKLYRLGEYEPYRTLRDAIAKAASATMRGIHSRWSGKPLRNPGLREDGFIWALRNISFDVEKGQAVGIIGHNGAGKTTLLKVLSRITEPTEGWVAIRGRVSSLLEVGTGFHPELTGRENIYLNGAILGMRKSEIDARFEEIVDFAEIKPFMETPVKRYSDGMRVRLGFAIAAHLQPEILLVDEVLAVGDTAFQRKCLGKMGEVTGEGRTVLFVSHNMAAVQNLCTVAFGLERGRIFGSGSVNDVISEYLERQTPRSSSSLATRKDRKGSGKIRLVGFSVSGAINSPDTAQCGARTTFEIAYEGKPPLKEVEVDILIYNQFGTCVLVAGNTFLGKPFDDLPPNGTLRCHFEKFPLMPGVYHLTFYCTVKGVSADHVKEAAVIHVVEGDYYGSGKLPEKGYGLVVVPYDWDFAVAPG